MKILLILSLVTLACSAKIYANRPVNNLDLLRSRTLVDDFKDIKALIPQSKLIDLIRRYLTKDDEFQRIIFYFGSSDVKKAGKLIGSQPELEDLYLWLKDHLRAVDLINTDVGFNGNLLDYKPNKQQLQSGWKGFMEELLAFYPRKEISNLIRDKVAANGVFAEFWNKITSLRPVYERILKTDEVVKVIVRLRELGVDTKQLDQLIREDFGWKTVDGAIEGKGNLFE